jgi:hypothetical protein
MLCGEVSQPTHELTPATLQLRRYACRQLNRGRYPRDRHLAACYIHAFALHGEDEFRNLLAALRQDKVVGGLLEEELLLHEASRKPGPCNDDGLAYLTMRTDRIVMVDSADSCAQARAMLLAPHVTAVGLDQERLLDNMDSTMHSLATHSQTLQLGIDDGHVFIFDLQHFHAVPGMDETLHALFTDPTKVKLGMAFKDDLRMMREDFPHAACFRCPVTSYCELSALANAVPPELWQQPLTHTPAGENAKEGKGGGKKKKTKEGGLGKLVRLATGHALCKEEQISNWSRRPLSAAQLHYAALDSYCEVLIYRHLEEKGFEAKLVDINNTGS